MTSLIFILSILFVFLLPLFFRREPKTERKDQQLQVATLGRTGSQPSEFFSYQAISLRRFKTGRWRRKRNREVAALFLYPSSFAEVAKQGCRETLKEIAREIPVVLVGAERFRARSLFETTLSYEEIIAGSGRNEYIQALFYFPNGEDFLFRTPGFTYQDQEELYQSLRLLQEAESYADWEQAFYEY